MRPPIARHSPAPADAPALRCANLWKAFARGEPVLRDINLSVARGECFGLLGPNGAGKTTTIEILEGLLRPTSGDVEVLGRRWARDERALRERIGITLQGTRLPEKLTVGETIDLFASFYPRPLDPLAALRTVGLDTRRDVRVRAVSEGQRQRLAVACALVGQPELLFLDEPTTGLDPHSRKQLWLAIQTFCGGGGTVVLTTNNMDEAERLCHRVALIDGGAIVASDAPAALVLHLGGDHVVEFAAAGTGGTVNGTRAMLADLPGVASVRRDERLWRLIVADVQRVVAAVGALARQHRLPLEHLTTRRATLEDVFLERTGRRYGED